MLKMLFQLINFFNLNVSFTCFHKNTKIQFHHGNVQRRKLKKKALRN